jgi:hypothetical protein
MPPTCAPLNTMTRTASSGQRHRCAPNPATSGIIRGAGFQPVLRKPLRTAGLGNVASCLQPKGVVGGWVWSGFIPVVQVLVVKVTPNVLKPPIVVAGSERVTGAGTALTPMPGTGIYKGASPIVYRVRLSNGNAGNTR